MDAKEPNTWRNANKAAFYEHAEKWIAFSPKHGIIDVGLTLKALINQLELKGFSRDEFVVKYVHSSELPYKK